MKSFKNQFCVSFLKFLISIQHRFSFKKFLRICLIPVAWASDEDEVRCWINRKYLIFHLIFIFCEKSNIYGGCAPRWNQQKTGNHQNLTFNMKKSLNRLSVTLPCLSRLNEKQTTTTKTLPWNIPKIITWQKVWRKITERKRSLSLFHIGHSKFDLNNMLTNFSCLFITKIFGMILLYLLCAFLRNIHIF